MKKIELMIPVDIFKNLLRLKYQDRKRLLLRTISLVICKINGLLKKMTMRISMMIRKREEERRALKLTEKRRTALKLTEKRNIQLEKKLL